MSDPNKKFKGNRRVPKALYDRVKSEGAPTADETLERIERRLKAAKDTEQARRALEAQLAAEKAEALTEVVAPTKRPRLRYEKPAAKLGSAGVIGMGEIAGDLVARQAMRIRAPRRLTGIVWSHKDVYDQLVAGYRPEQVARRTKYSLQEVLDFGVPLKLTPARPRQEVVIERVVRGAPPKSKSKRRVMKPPGNACGEKKGTNAGAQRHWAAGESACDECKTGRNAYEQSRKAQR